jgi:putrescine importer
VHDGVALPALLTGATVVCFSFIGFDAVTMYTEEAKSPRTMPKAIMLTVLIGGGIFIVCAYLAQLRFPTNAPFGEFTDDPLPQIGLLVGGRVFQAVLVAAGFVAALASGLASHASVARMLLVMGRNNVLPKRLFGAVNPKTRTPVFNVVLVGAVTLLAMSFSLDTISSYINFGALIAFTFVNASVIMHFAVREGRRHTTRDRLTFIVLPGVAMLLTGVLWSQLHADALIAGGVWAAIGFVYLLIITRGFRRTPQNFDENQPVTGVNKALTSELD